VKRLLVSLFTGLVLAALGVLVPLRTQAATLTLRPSETDLEVGQIFEVAVLLNTDQEEINAVELILEFPADKLQVISPNTGRSFIEIWAGQPKFNNKTGRIEMRGGVPNGLTIENGLVTIIQFRVKAAGSISLQFTAQTRVLANDGLGTDFLIQTPGIFLTSQLPKPAGPLVSSLTHPNPGRWYDNADVALGWQVDEGAGEGYSYIFNDEPLVEPDTISEGGATNIVYNQISSGVHFFHIRALRAGLWGGSTHFQVSIDTAPPASFKIEAIPALRTVSRQPVLKFFTSDAQSGIDHFEIKLISLAPAEGGEPPADELFSDAQSPYVTYPLDLGSYDVLVRAYDKAHNYREAKERLIITTPIFSLVQDNGIQLTESFTLTWPWMWLSAALILVFFTFTSWRLKHWPRKLGLHERTGDVPNIVQKQLEELKTYRKKYGKLAAVVLIAIAMSFGGASVRAQSVDAPRATSVLTPPNVTTISTDITTEETFYIGGETVVPSTDVVIYWNNLTTGETLSAITTSNGKGEWFYHHPTALVTGNYMLWAQSRIGETMSPPSPQLTMVIRTGAIKLGPARVSYEMLYLSIITLLIVILLTLGFLIIKHWATIKRQHRLFLEEVRKGEESIRRGFAILRRDMELEFALIKKAKMERKLSREEEGREAQLVKDLSAIEERVGQEIWELEELEHER